jgi:hypothetical protein
LFGERYFVTRERLSDVMRGITQLAADTGADLGALPSLAEIRSRLDSPFLFVLCGEARSGKSTLINALSGHDLCQIDLPPSERVLCYLHGNPPCDKQLTPLLEQCQRPLEFLREFNLVEFPDFHLMTQDHQSITDLLLRTADLILFVFPSSNPWCASTWNAISQLDSGNLQRAVFIIQQADQLESNEISVILGHMADLAMKRIGQIPPVFAVSAQRACSAQRATPVAADILLASGLPTLENFLSKHICQSSARRGALETGRNYAAAGLHIVEEHIEEETRDLHSHNRFLEHIECEIKEIREQFVTRLPLHLAGVAGVFESEAVFVSQRLRRHLRAFPSIIRLFTGDRTGPQIETVFIERLQSAIEAIAENDGIEVADACLNHWQTLGERIQNAIDIELQPVKPIETTLAEAKLHFVQRLGHAARQGIGNLSVRNQLEKEIRRRNLALRSFIFMTLVLTITGASCGALGVPWVPAIACALAALFLAGGIVAAWATRKPITRDFQSRLLDTCGSFAVTLYADYEESLRMVFHDYAASLDNLRTHLARESLVREPLQRRWQELFLTLKATEQEL